MSDDPYDDCLQALMTAVRTLNIYFKKSYQVGINHGEVTSRGGEYWFICTPGAFPSSRMTGRTKIYQWQTSCDLYVRYTEESQSIPKFMAIRADLIKLLEKPRVLKDINVKSIQITGGNLVQDLPGDNPDFIIQPIVITIEQIVAI